MKSNRMRLFTPTTSAVERLHAGFIHSASTLPLSMESLPAPLPIAKISPDQLIEDILLATLRRVKEQSSPEVAAAAARYITLLSENAL